MGRLRLGPGGDAEILLDSRQIAEADPDRTIQGSDTRDD